MTLSFDSFFQSGISNLDTTEAPAQYSMNAGIDEFVIRTFDYLGVSPIGINDHQFYAMKKQSISKINYLPQFDLQTSNHTQLPLFDEEDILSTNVFSNA
jgi:hypothetical protein